MSDIVIIGGGPAGATAALWLARAGRTPMVLERDVQPVHRMCGEFVSVETAAALRAAGIEPSALGAVEIDTLRLFGRRRMIETALPFTALGLSRRAMDTALLQAAEEAGASTCRVTAKRIDGQSVETEQGTLTSHSLILATGKHELRGAGRDTHGTMADLVGFKMHWRLKEAQTTALTGAIEIHLFDGGYAGLQLVEGGIANLCLLVSQPRLASSGKQWAGLLDSLLADCPALSERLTGATALFDRPLTISGVPYGFVYRPGAADSPSTYRVGDQLAVIPSFAGDGMAIAMSSGRAAAEAIIGGKDARAWHSAQRQRYAGQIRLASALHHLARSSLAQETTLAALRLWPGLARQIALATRVRG